MQAEKTEVIRTGITGSTLKIIAMITMLIDHIGATIVLQLVQRNSDNFDAFGNVRMTGMVILYYVLRGIGRLAFPIFIFLLLEGFQYTHNRFLYIGRLLLFAIISEIPFDLAVNLSTNSILKGHVLEFTSQNVFFTLFIGLMTMIAFRWIEEHTDWSGWQRVILYIAALVCGIVVAELLQTDYAGKGVVCIMALYIFRKTKVQQIIAGCVAFCWELTAPIAFLPIAFYNGKRGLKIKYFFYAFYPVHLLILYLVVCLMGMGNMPAM